MDRPAQSPQPVSFTETLSQSPVRSVVSQVKVLHEKMCIAEVCACIPHSLRMLPGSKADQGRLLKLYFSYKYSIFH